ncbi:MAG TPA: GyrI-like domain-containing protein [Bacteroidota bacterium]|nr:GyrI-like domain-containing protein [Bacteroidota bacterium]
MIPRITQRSDSKIIGMEVRTSNQLETMASSAKIPLLWKKFHEEKEKIPNRKNEQTSLGVYTNYKSDHSGEYSLIAASEVSSLDKIPEGMVAHIIPPGKFLIFSAKGRMPQAVVNAWKQIWKYFANGSQFKRAFTVDFETYNSANEDEVDIHIAIL